jgi:hypothetical protein
MIQNFPSRPPATLKLNRKLLNSTVKTSSPPETYFIVYPMQYATVTTMKREPT